MLARRVKSILTTGENAAFVRSYVAGVTARPNLTLHRERFINEKYSSATKTRLPINTSQRWLDGIAKENSRIITRVCHTAANEDRLDILEPNQTENGYARTVLMNSKHNLTSLATPLPNIESVSEAEAEKLLAQDWSAASVEDVLEAFRKLSCHAKSASCSMEEDKHKNILDALTAKSSELSDSQICQIFQCLQLWTGVTWNRIPAYTNWCQNISKECLKRLVDWTSEEALLICDYMFLLRLTRKVHYPNGAMKKVGKKPKRLTAPIFLHYIFLLNLCRMPPVNMYEIEYQFDTILNEYTADELGVVAMGFFKTETRFRDKQILSKIQLQTLKEIDTIQDISLSAILKITRYNTGLKDLNVLREILEKVQPRISRTSLTTLVHLLHAAAFVQLHNVKTTRMIIQRFEEDINKARLKDLERFTWALCIFNYDADTPIFKTIVESIRSPKRAEELERYAAILPTTMLHLSFTGILPMDLIKHCLSAEFLERVYQNNAFKTGWDYFALENNVRTEMPEYDGPFLKENIRRFLTKKYLFDVLENKTSRVHPADRMILETAHMCKLVLGSITAIHIDHLLPHFMKPDIVICLDESNNPVAPEPILSKIPLGMTKTPPPEAQNFKWIALVLATQNQTMTDSGEYVGPFVAKLRQLRKIGYEPIVISNHHWRALPSLEAKQDYIRKILPISTDQKQSAEAV